MPALLVKGTVLAQNVDELVILVFTVHMQYNTHILLIQLIRTITGNANKPYRTINQNWSTAIACKQSANNSP